MTKITQGSFEGGLNTDTDKNKLNPNFYTEAHNVELVGAGDFTALTNLLGTTNVQTVINRPGATFSGAFENTYKILGANKKCLTIMTLEDAVPVNVTPGTGELTMTGYAPVANTTDSTIASPSTGELTITGFAPTVDADVLYYNHRRGNTPSGTECSVCPPSYGASFFYTSPSDTVPTISMVVYTDASLTTPFNGGNQWWGIEWDGPSSSTIDGIQISTLGVVTDTHICSIDCPPVTTTLAPTTTPAPPPAFTISAADLGGTADCACGITPACVDWGGDADVGLGMCLASSIEILTDTATFDSAVGTDGIFWMSDGVDVRQYQRDGNAFTATPLAACTTCIPVTTTLAPTTTAATPEVILDKYAVSDTCSSTTSCTCGGTLDERVTSTVNNMIAPYTYEWEYVSGSLAITPNTPTAFRTTFTGEITCNVPSGNTEVAIFRLKVTDSDSPAVVAYSSPVTLTFTNTSTTCD